MHLHPRFGHSVGSQLPIRTKHRDHTHPSATDKPAHHVDTITESVPDSTAPHSAEKYMTDSTARNWLGPAATVYAAWGQCWHPCGSTGVWRIHWRVARGPPRPTTVLEIVSQLISRSSPGTSAEPRCITSYPGKSRPRGESDAALLTGAPRLYGAKREGRRNAGLFQERKG